MLITSFSFAFSLLGLTLGTVLAQILLALVFMFLPVVLLLSAVPSKGARALLPKVAKLAFFAAMAHAVFLLVLTSMVLLIDILTNAVVASTDPGSVIRIIFLAAMPIVCQKDPGSGRQEDRARHHLGQGQSAHHQRHGRSESRQRPQRSWRTKPTCTSAVSGIRRTTRAPPLQGRMRAVAAVG